jgi:CMP-N-acetylneuraminic acid synthetase
MTIKIAALVPMRHESVRVPGKNYRPLGGKPLFHHILMTLMAVPEFGIILVDTDSNLIIEDIATHFPGVHTVLRPESLRGDRVPMNEILIHDTALIEADYYLQTHSTNPLLKPETISKAIKAFLAALPEYDSLFGVTRLQTRLWDRAGKPINHDPAILLRTQDLPPVYEENSCIYIFSRESLLARGNRLGARPMMFEIPAVEAWDIDEELDFTVADILYRYLYEDANQSMGEDRQPGDEQ